MTVDADFYRIVNGPEFTPWRTENDDLMVTENGDFIVFAANVRTDGKYHHEKRRTWLK